MKVVEGRLNCEDCIYNDNCDTLWKRCVANCIDEGVTKHYEACEIASRNKVNEEIMNIVNSLPR